MNLNEIMKLKYNKSVSDCTNKEIYYALLETVQNMSEKKLFKKSEKKKLYYISAEFLIGKLLSNNLINLGIYDEVKQQFVQIKKLRLSVPVLPDSQLLSV